MSKFTFRGWLKSRIVTLALLGFVPMKLVYWLFQHGGLSNE